MNYHMTDSFFEDAGNGVVIRQRHIDLWSDLLLYAKNLRGNWMVSKEIFNRTLVPTAEENPTLFAKSVNDMVKVSGVKIRCSSLFYKSIRYLKRFRDLKRARREDIPRVVTSLIDSGLDETIYAKKAIDRINSKSSR